MSGLVVLFLETDIFDDVFDIVSDLSKSETISLS